MSIRLIHPFRFDKRVNWPMLLDNVHTFAAFEKNIIDQCNGKFNMHGELDDSEYASEDEEGKKRRTFLGDAFEVFVEMLIKSNEHDIFFGVSGYKPCHPHLGQSDYGVDGHGTGLNNYPATVQSKFRSPNVELFANKDRLVNFKNSSHEDFKVRFTDTQNMVIVTNCKGVNWFTNDKMLNKKVRCFHRDHIIQLTTNEPFWDHFRILTAPIVPPTK